MSKKPGGKYSKDKDAAPEPRKKRLTRSIKHVFSQEDRIEIGLTITTKLNEIEQKQDEAKGVAQEFKAKVAQLEAELNTARNGFSSGFEMRSTEVVEVMDRPKPGQKEICVEDDDADGGLRILFSEKMTFSDLNPPLPGITEPEKIDPGAPLNPVKTAVEKAENDQETGEEEAV